MTHNKKVVSLYSANHIDEQAAMWLVKLDSGNFSAQSRADLKNWLAADPKHQEALTAMMNVWDDIDGSLALVNDEKLTEDVHFSDVLIPVLKPLSIAASVCIVCIFVFLNSAFNVEKNTYATRIGEQLQTKFSDGSVMHLNTNSQIETEFSKDKRLIKLLKGEALFDVAHDKERPFIVYAGDRLVQAVGTKFSVQLTPKKVDVMVAEGKVVMSETSMNQELKNIVEINISNIKIDDIFISQEQEVTLRTGQTQQQTFVKTSHVEQSLAWLDGKIIFKDEKLINVINEVNRYIDQEILLYDSLLQERRISGNFNITDREALIEALTLSFDIEPERIGNNKILLRKKDV